ncbi:TIM barrel protein [Litoreibacter meonggei]|nr:TIM barrel protein [Litoreibacter meonggei]
MPASSTVEVLDAAKSLGCVGVELRNDLASEIFDGRSPAEIRDEACVRGLSIFVLAEVYAFNDNTTQTRNAALSLARAAQECGAEAIALIPRVAEMPIDRAMQRALLRDALNALRPMLEDNGITALIEPLGFSNSSLRQKGDAMAVLEDMGRPDCFALIHDTFHHALSGEAAYFADATRMVHISGVADPTVATRNMIDAHRGLIDSNDRLGSIDQISHLRRQGYSGPLSFEAFAPDVHELIDPTSALSASTAFITSNVAELAA